jgi:glycine dehydrogenase subunit 2
VGYRLPELDVEAVPVESLIDNRLLRDDNLSGLPEVSEVDVVRHFTRISTWNYAVDLGMYPLGSCTMKYNPKLNERVSRFEGFAAAHPARQTSCRREACGCCGTWSRRSARSLVSTQSASSRRLGRRVR